MESKCKELMRRMANIRAQLEVFESNANVERDALLAVNSLNRDALSVREALSSSFCLNGNRERQLHWRRRVSMLLEECDQIRTSLGSYYSRRSEEQRVLEERERLLNSGDASGQQQQCTIDMDRVVLEGASLQRSHSMADDVLDMGAGVLQELRAQGDRLKAVQRRLLDIAVTLGIAKSLMRVIERRQLSDKIVLFGGMIFVSLLLIVMWWFFR
jgi:Snare region anchored in the vesicle membrane C-terminus